MTHLRLSSSETWCRPVVTDQRDGPRGYANEDASRSAISAFLDADSALIIRNGRYPIDTSSGTIGLVTGDGPPGIIPNDSYVANDTPFTVVTGINGMLLLVFTVRPHISVNRQREKHVSEANRDNHDPGPLRELRARRPGNHSDSRQSLLPNWECRRPRAQYLHIHARNEGDGVHLQQRYG